MTETVEVSSLATVVDTTQSKVAGNGGQGDSGQHPERALLRVGDPVCRRRAPGAAAGRQRISRSTAPAIRENVYLIDGVNTTNIQNGGVGKSFQMDFVEEVQVKSSSFEAEFGGALGGVINAVAKRGSNDWHGSLLQLPAQPTPCNANNGDRGLRTNPSLLRSTPPRVWMPLPNTTRRRRTSSTIVEPGYNVGGAL